MRKTLVSLLVVALIAMFATTAVFAKGNARKGKRVWKKNCRLACHDGSKANAPALSPVSKTQAQWKALLPKIKECAAHQSAKKLSDKDIENIFQYLYDHALDSDQPETCG
ncbi:cytochrome c [Deferribacter thermophilus]|uniref:c-type cytochrome n=1 Tax=Deferribacter thermophilus TaxID=53573 RepID=UPI003C243231